MRNQPIYDNKNLKNAGKYNFENVNDINKRMGEMQFDSSIKKDNSQYKNRILITSIISSLLLVATIIFAFTDIKYIFFPKKNIVDENKDFEDLNLLHELSCSAVLEQNGLSVSVDKLYKYNNNKVKVAIYTYVINVSDERLLSDSSFSTYINDTFADIKDRYNNIVGLDIAYSNDGSSYKFIQTSDLRIIDKDLVSSEFLDVHLDQNIENVKTMNQRSGITCK